MEVEFSFEKFGSLRAEDLLEEETEFLIPDLLVKNSVTMWYSKPSQGKTWFTYAVAKELLARYKGLRKLFYCDFDNGKRQIKERNVDRELIVDPRFTYFHKGSIDATPTEFIESINSESFGANLQDCVFIFDSTRDFVDNVANDHQAKRFMQVAKNIRESGGTVILIHHTSKSGKVMKGSGEFASSADNAFELTQSGKTPGKIHYILKVVNDRDSVIDCAFSVLLERLELQELDPIIEKLTPEKQEWVTLISEELAKRKKLTQTECIAILGHDRTHRPSRDLLHEFVDVFWKKEDEGKKSVYTPI